MLSRSAISPLSDPAWPITFWLAAFGFLVTTICLSREVKGSMIYGIVFVTFVSWFRDTSVTVFLDTTLENSNYKYFKQACVERIKKDETGQKHCTGQYFDYWSCIDQCVAPKLFEKLK